MQMSARARYAFRIVLELSLQYGRGLISADVVAKRQEISEKFIHVLVGPLRSAGLIYAVRGPNGGYQLAKDPELISVYDVILAIEGRVAPVACVRELDYCGRASLCVSREVWREVGEAVENTLSSYSFQRLVSMHRERQNGTVDYQI